GADPEGVDGEDDGGHRGGREGHRHHRADAHRRELVHVEVGRAHRRRREGAGHRPDQGRPRRGGEGMTLSVRTIRRDQTMNHRILFVLSAAVLLVPGEAPAQPASGYQYQRTVVGPGGGVYNEQRGGGTVAGPFGATAGMTRSGYYVASGGA